MNLYKISIITILSKQLIIAFVFTLFYFFVSTKHNLIGYFISFFLVVLLEVFFFFYKSFLYKIIIYEESITFYYKIFLFRKYFIEINRNDFSFSYKLEKGAKGIESYELRFYEKNVKIDGIGRGFDGWNKKQINMIIYKLKTLNFKKTI